MDAFIPFIKAVGRGEKLKRNLTRQEAYNAMELILTNKATPAQIGALLIAQRVKEETMEEILGFTQAARAYSNTITPKVKGLMDLALPYDGKSKTLQLAPVIALVLAAAGQPVVMHGDHNIPTKCGIGPAHILETLGVTVDLPVNKVKKQIEKLGIGFLYAPQFAPAWHKLTPLRHQFGLRTALNTVEKFLNPANAEIIVAGFFHRNYILRMLDIGRQLAPEIWIVQGIEGSIECTPERANPVYSTNPHIDTLTVRANQFGLDDKGDIKAPSNVEIHATTITEVLQGKINSAYTTAILTAGLLLYLGHRVSDIKQGIEEAEKAIKTGKSLKKLEQWQKQSH